MSFGLSTTLIVVVQGVSFGVSTTLIAVVLAVIVSHSNSECAASA